MINLSSLSMQNTFLQLKERICRALKLVATKEKQILDVASSIIDEKLKFRSNLSATGKYFETY